MVTVGGMVLGMSNTVVTPPKAAARGAALEVFLVRIAGIAEMHMHVDGAGQHMQAGGIDGLASRRGIASGAPTARILPSLIATLASNHGIGRDDVAAVDDEIGRVAHQRRPSRHRPAGRRR